MVIGNSSCVMRSELSTQHSALGSPAPLSHLASDRSRFTVHGSRSSEGFTILEMLIVLFLLGGVLVLVVPRIDTREDLSSTGRKFIGTIRTLQRLAEVGQKPVKLYLDLDQGTYWVMVMHGKEERRPLDATWATPKTLPDMIRITEVSVAQTKRTYGRADLVFLPNGRIEPASLYFSDSGNNLLVLVIDSLTGNIRTFDQRPEFIRPRPIPERVKPLLQAKAQPQAAPSAVRTPSSTQDDRDTDSKTDGTR